MVYVYILLNPQHPVESLQQEDWKYPDVITAVGKSAQYLLDVY